MGVWLYYICILHNHDKNMEQAPFLAKKCVASQRHFHSKISQDQATSNRPSIWLSLGGFGQLQCDMPLHVLSLMHRQLLSLKPQSPQHFIRKLSESV